MAGQQFEFAFDDIGNRTSTLAGGDANGTGLRSASYGANALNQYTNRTVPGAVDILGAAHALSTVTVNDDAAYRKGEYFWKEVALDNASAPVWNSLTTKAVYDGETNTVTGNVFLPPATETFTYDADGNLTSDGRWTNRWDAENRLVEMETLSSVPDGAKLKVKFTYDSQGRRVAMVVSNYASGNWYLEAEDYFAYDGWNCLAVLHSDFSILNSFTWGLDLSGSLQGAGGVGGLVAMNAGTNGVHFYAMDGNGNVAALVDASDGTKSATYEFSPFGQIIRASGAMAKLNPFRFSTKYQDDYTDLAYYGYRFCNLDSGRWLNRDRVGEGGGLNLYSFLQNSPHDRIDALGLMTLSHLGDGFQFVPGDYKFWLGIYSTFDSAEFTALGGTGFSVQGYVASKATVTWNIRPCSEMRWYSREATAFFLDQFALRSTGDVIGGGRNTPFLKDKHGKPAGAGLYFNPLNTSAAELSTPTGANEGKITLEWEARLVKETDWIKNSYSDAGMLGDNTTGPSPFGIESNHKTSLIHQVLTTSQKLGYYLPYPVLLIA